MKDYTIGITTFSKRYSFIVKLLSQIRSHTDKPIVISINGEKDAEFNEEYRKKILLLCSEYDNVFPTFFLETRGLSKMWNTLLIMSYHDNVLMLNDDIEIHSSDIFDITTAHINSNVYNGLTKMNSSFSHFIVSKNLMDEIGYFDERLLGFGEEDGDISYRLLKVNKRIDNIGVPRVLNIVSNVRHDFVKSGIGKYSEFNRTFIYGEKYTPETNGKHRGMFDTPMKQLLDDNNQYPNEKYFLDNKHRL
jgi:hypothetical protein